MEPSVGGPWERVGLGSTSTTVSRVGLGLHATGNLPPDRDAQAHDLIRHAFDVGINLIDTAPVYGAGSAERRLGDALAGLDRRSVVISTKVGYLLRPRRMGPTIRRTTSTLPSFGYPPPRSMVGRRIGPCKRLSGLPIR